MVIKSEVVKTERVYVVSSKELKKLFGIKNPEKISSFGCWVGRSPHDEQSNVDPDSVDQWYIKTTVGDGLHG